MAAGVVAADVDVVVVVVAAAVVVVVVVVVEPHSVLANSCHHCMLEVLRWDSATTRWRNKTLVTGYGCKGEGTWAHSSPTTIHIRLRDQTVLELTDPAAVAVVVAVAVGTPDYGAQARIGPRQPQTALLDGGPQRGKPLLTLTFLRQPPEKKNSEKEKK